VDASHLAAKAMISRKHHLTSLQLNCSSSISRSSNVSNLEQQLIQEVYEYSSYGGIHWVSVTELDVGASSGGFCTHQVYVAAEPG
jgi:hypothetical protein